MNGRAFGGGSRCAGTGGAVTTPFGGTPRAVARQADGKLIVAGSSSPIFEDDDDFALVRYEADGTLDATFGMAGKVLTDIGVGDRLHAVLVQPDGQAVMLSPGRIVPEAICPA